VLQSDPVHWMIGKDNPLEGVLLKRLTLAAAAAAIAICGLMGIAAGSASATVFCKTQGYFKCPAGNYYQVGDKLELHSGAVQLKVYGYLELACSHSNLDMTITDDGGSLRAEAVRTRVDKFTLESCNKTPTVLSNGNTYTVWNLGSFSGSTYLQETSFKVKSNTFGVNCTFTFSDPGTLYEPATLNGTDASSLVFKNTPISAKVCTNATINATYDFKEPNQRVFVLQE
jgi:hypothetical protein